MTLNLATMLRETARTTPDHPEYARAREYRDLWVVVFDADGLCVDFEEWPYFPGQSITAPRD